MIVVSQDSSRTYFTETLLSVRRQDVNTGDYAYCISAETANGASVVARYRSVSERDMAFNNFVQAVTLQQPKFRFPSDVEIASQLRAQTFADQVRP